MEDKQRGALETAAAVVGLLSGVVASVYLLGGLVIALRMLHDDFAPASIVSVLGQLPREVVMTTALLEVIGPAMVVGLVAALVYGVADGPKPRAWRNDELDEGPHWKLFLALFGVFAVAFSTPSLYQAWKTDGFTPFVVLLTLVVLAVTYALVAAGWYLLRKIGRKRWYRLVKAAAAGAIWAAAAATPAALLASLLEFDEAQVCVTGSQAPVYGLLIGEGGSRVLLEQEFGREASVLSLPADQVGKVEYGDLSSTFACPAPAGEGGSPAAAAKLGGHGSAEERRLAIQLRPRLRFDGSERWRPLEVEPFLAERFEGGGHHGACPRGDVPPCPAVGSAARLRPGRLEPAYVDIHGEGRNGDDFGSPSAGCLRSPPALDCNSGPDTAIYYRRTTHEGRWYWDYWWFFRYSDYTGRFNDCRAVCGDHEGDWEGITVITTASLEPEIIGAVYASHRHRVLVDAATLPAASGHPLVWIASGTHASYPYDCDRNCKQYGRVLPEEPHDGAVPWGGNRDSECAASECVQPLPGFGGSSEAALPIASGWAGWPGKWGATCHDGCPGLAHREGSPSSPGLQARFRCPWVPTLRARPAANGSGLSDSAAVGDRERLYATCLARRGGS